MKIDLRCVSNKPNSSMSFEEIEEKVNELNKHHSELLSLDNDAFLSEETGKELDQIHTEILELIRKL